MDDIKYNFLYRYFVGLGMDEDLWVPEVFSVNRERLLEHRIVRKFFKRVLKIDRISEKFGVF